MFNVIKLRASITLLAIGLATSQSASAAISCDEGKRYYDLARKAGSQQDFTKASQWLDKSVQACDSYEAWHLLGTAHQKQRQIEASLNAYEKAVEFAPNPDKAAISLARYGQVLSLNGQRYEALTMLDQAIETHSSPPSWMRENARQIDHSLVNKPVSGESIKRSLASQEFGLLSSNKFGLNQSAARKAAKTKVRIPINFEYNSVELDELTRANMQELGSVLASDAYKNRNFTLVGHTDVRGNWDYNLSLSRLRAEAARDALLGTYPDLAGRLRIKGAGEAQPKYPGEQIPEEDHRLNRRLEVLVN